MHIQEIKPARRRKVFLRKSYRRDGKVKKKTLVDLSRWSVQGVSDLKHFLALMRQLKKQGVQVSALVNTIPLYCWFGGESAVMEFIDPFRPAFATTSDAQQIDSHLGDSESRGLCAGMQ